MKVEDAIKGRRSIRRYTEEMPAEEVIQKILEAGIWAPSGLNNQPWKFKVIKDKDEKDGLAEFTHAPVPYHDGYGTVRGSAPRNPETEGTAGVNPRGSTSYGSIIKDAPVVICIFLDKSVMYNREKDTVAIGACIQNMLLQAHELGIGSCWLGEILNKKEGVEKYLKTHSDYELMAVVTLGYSDEKATSSRKKLKNFLL